MPKSVLGIWSVSAEYILLPASYNVVARDFCHNSGKMALGEEN
jgi:hypothetical protein